MKHVKKLPGRYKGTRKRKPRPEIIWIECPGCGWRGHPGKLFNAEAEYVLHLEKIHYGILECAFCDTSICRGLRLLPDFETLASHVRSVHPEIVAAHEKVSGHTLGPGALVPRSFKI
jgi:hypothetical protein